MQNDTQRTGSREGTGQEQLLPKLSWNVYKRFYWERIRKCIFPLGQLILSKYKFTYRFVYIQRVFCSYFPSGIIFLKLTFVCDILESFSKNICRVNSGNDIEWYHKEMIFWSNTMCWCWLSDNLEDI